MKYIDADKLIATLERQNVDKKVIQPLIRIIGSLQQEQDLIIINKKAWEAQEQFRKNKDFGKPLQQEHQEEPSKSLQEEIETWIPAHISIRTDETLSVNPTEIANACKEWGKGIARHFYELGKNSK